MGHEMNSPGSTPSGPFQDQVRQNPDRASDASVSPDGQRMSHEKSQSHKTSDGEWIVKFALHIVFRAKRNLPHGEQTSFFAPKKDGSGRCGSAWMNGRLGA